MRELRHFAADSPQWSFRGPHKSASEIAASLLLTTGLWDEDVLTYYERWRQQAKVGTAKPRKTAEIVSLDGGECSKVGALPSVDALDTNHPTPKLSMQRGCQMNRPGGASYPTALPAQTQGDRAQDAAHDEKASPREGLRSL